MHHHGLENGHQNGFSDDDDQFEREQSDQYEVASTVQAPCHDMIASGQEKLESVNEREEEKSHQIRGFIPFEKVIEDNDGSDGICDLQDA